MKPVFLTILDGWGYSKQKHGNAILNARTPNIDEISRSYPSLLLQASGTAAGMTWGEPGNSEVGHITIGAGRIIFQYLSQINKAISDGTFFNNEILLKAINHTKTNHSTLHLAGLLTSGSVHSFLNHLLALIDLAAANQVSNLKIHLFTDGKDSGLKEAPILIKKVLDYTEKAGVGQIASIIGRNLAMDRNRNWDYTQKAYDLLVRSEGDRSTDVFKKLDGLYAAGITDADLPPIVLADEGEIRENDAVIFFNFREDSMRQLARSFIEKNFQIFPVKNFENLFIVAMTQFLDDSRLNIAFPIPKIQNGLAEFLSKHDQAQFHIAETEKYAHVTYFFNCLNNAPLKGETDIFMESVKDPLEHPEMRANEIVMKVKSELERDFYNFILINLANADILSHLGNFETTIKAVEAIDTAIGKLREAVLKKDGILIITADHGNAESLVYKSSGESETRHNDNPVPFYLIGKEFERSRNDNEIAKSMTSPAGLLSDIAPTILELMKMEKPEEMTGESLLKIIK